jgi:purine-nucleoside phosphorylase
MKEKVQETVKFLQENGMNEPEVGIILGTGLGALVDEIEIEVSLNYEDIPHFPISTVEFHHGKLIFGKLSGKRVIAMQGRFHYYEGYSLAEVVFPVRVMKFLGIQQILISNAGGNMNMNWQKGQLMLIEDHINLLPDNPLRGNGAAEFGPIFVDLSRPYDPDINQLLKSIAQKKGITLNSGIYVVVSGPNLETRAEYRYLRNLGADVVGMSTVPEVIVANQMGLPAAAISVMTDDCDPDNLAPINIEEILETAKTAEKDLVILIKELLTQLHSETIS